MAERQLLVPCARENHAPRWDGISSLGREPATVSGMISLRGVSKSYPGGVRAVHDLDLDIALAVLIGPLTYRRVVQGEAITDDFIAAVLPGAIAALRSTVPASAAG